MKKYIPNLVIAVALLFTANISNAQTAMQLNGVDCNGNKHDLFADLDAGKAVILHFFMANCGSCPPPAQKIQAMAKNILNKYPGMITAYAMPFNNSTTCSYASSWVSSNGLSLYMPYDSGAMQVANYGGFGMPTVVVLGGKNHQILFSTQSFSTSDTSTMRSKILALLSGTSGIADISVSDANFNIFPNPANEFITINLTLKSDDLIFVEILDMTGKQISIIMNETRNAGNIVEQFDASVLPVGCYLIRSKINGQIATQKLSIVR